MASIQIKSNVSIEDLIQGVAQLKSEELDNFIQQILSIRAKRRVDNLEERESALLALINQIPADDLWIRFKELDIKRQEERLSEEDHLEFIKLSEEIERYNVERLTYLSELAILRQTDLRTLMEQLGITPKDV